MKSLPETYILETKKVFRQHKEMAEEALGQLDNDSDFFHVLGTRSHSIAVTVKHVSLWESTFPLARFSDYRW